MNKKFLTLIVSGVMCVPMAFGIAGCNKKDKNINIVAKDVYALSAVSGATYLKEMENSTSLTSKITATTRPAHFSDADANNLKNSIQMFNQILLDDTLTQQTTLTPENDPYFGTYNFVMNISVPNTNGGVDEFKMYYNETETKTNKEIEDASLEVEVSTKLEGIMVVGSDVFDVYGEREFETEGNESESSIEFTTKSKTNPNNFIKISQEVENNEVEFEYEIYKGGIKVSESEFEIEQEKNHTVVELEFKNSNQNKATYKLIKGNNSNEFNVTYKNGATTDTLKIVMLENAFEFTYSNGFTEIINI
mgnify:CR=1 FL=1